MGLLKKRRCRNCRRLFAPNPRNIDSQKYCSRSECRKASKRCSQKKWLNKPENRNYFCGPAHVERVQEWRKMNPGYWKKTKSPDTLQDSILPQPAENKQDSTQFMDNALQDFLRAQPPVIIGLIWLTLVNKKYQSLPQKILWGMFINHCKGGVIDSTADHADIRGLVTA